MNEEFGTVAFETVTNQYLGGDAALACSFEAQTGIGEKAVEVIRAQYEKANHN